MPLPIPPKGRLGVTSTPGSGASAAKPPVQRQPSPAEHLLKKESKPPAAAQGRPQAQAVTLPVKRADGLTEAEYEAGWRVDARTGKRYKSLPKQVIDGQGFSESHMDDLEDAFSGLDSVADKYLAHLRVAPTAEELRQLKAEEARLRRMQNEEFALEQEAVGAELKARAPKGTAAERKLREKLQEEAEDDFEDSQWS